MIFRRESSCRYSSPLAVPVMMFARFCQSSSLHFCGSKRKRSRLLFDRYS
uniref:Uncharacterized protein n=1 Tax=Rhizophora mucronata TaxID=61149 RepID=A0A2P2QDD2_RHIMU